jgi:large subunit ribosomal protein L21
MERLLKKKRRKGYEKTIEHKQGWTSLRVGDIVLGEGVRPETEAGTETEGLA